MKWDVEVLQGALKLIEGDERWCKGKYCDIAPELISTGIKISPTAFCLEGAIRHAAGFPYGIRLAGMSNEDSELVWDQVVRLEHKLTVLSCHQAAVASNRLFIFNDDPKTTQEDAILLLKRGIEELQQEVTT